jgi:7,8-dihydropterin-6-yl-methyl-4-(beta-D-ribofuranosyl)aminobenzene 5'-phosphate synthase
LFILTAVIAAVAAGISAGALAQAEEKAGNSITIVYNHEGTAAADLVKRGGFSAFVRLEDRSLARISHQLSAAGADTPHPAVFSRLGVLDVPQVRAPRPSGRKPHWARHLAALATKPGEICRLVFDAGGEASVILENLHSLGFDNIELDALVISHNHWDHVFGLPGVMSGARNTPPVYVAASAADGIKQQFPRADVIAVDGPKKIAPEVWLTGPLEIEFMGAPLSEQALVLEHPDGLHVVVGCSHPGIVAIVERVQEMFPEAPIAFVGGGFHLRSTGEAEIRKIADALERLGVRKIGPSHCTGGTAVSIFRDRWGKNFVNFDLGDTYRF